MLVVFPVIRTSIKIFANNIIVIVSKIVIQSFIKAFELVTVQIS